MKKTGVLVVVILMLSTVAIFLYLRPGSSPVTSASRFAQAAVGSKEQLALAYELKAEEPAPSFEVLSLIERVSERVRVFEASFTPSDIAQISEDDPHSFFRKLGFYSSLKDGRECTQAALGRLSQELNESERDNALLVMTLLDSYKAQFLKSTVQHIISLMNRDPRFQSYRDLGQTYYPLLLEKADSTNQTDEYVKLFENNLNEAGVPRDHLRSYTESLALKSPECIGRFNTKLGEYLQVHAHVHAENE